MKEFKVKIWVGGRRSEVNVKATNGTSAMSVAKRLFPDARVITAQQLK
ncbi:conserved hypothetical protein [Flavobacterium sp. 9AF]|nr:conserved hypothetical protein [Flavobacterium sp. 9AF]